MEKKSFKIEKIIKIIESKETEELERCLEELELKFKSIGHGGNAEIFVAEGTSFEKICFKKIREKQQMKFNSIDEEHEKQIEAESVGVRTPLSLISFITKEGEEYLVMQRINGNNIKEILTQTSLLPEKFDYKIFCKSLDEQVYKMNNSRGIDNGIHHRDLHLENIMIDEEGLPVVIDFGLSAIGTPSENTYVDFIDMYDEYEGRYKSKEVHLKNDIEKVREIKEKLRIFKKK